METTKQQQFERYAQPVLQASKINEDRPLSYLDWYQTHTGIIPGQEFKQYNEYLLRWYREKNQVNSDYNSQIRINFLTLLKQLQLFFSNEEAQTWYNQVDLNDEKEILLAIPYFAKKLRDISLYYIQLRREIKKSKLKYNLKGTNTGIVQQLKEQLLTAFTKSNNTPVVIPSSLFKNVPELSSVRDSFTVQVEELYDDHSYFDQSPTLPVSAYYDITNPAVEEYFASKSLALSSANWIYKAGTIDISEDVIVDGINFTTALLEKYIADDKFTAALPSVSSEDEFFTHNIQTGNNFFYWPSGPYPSNTLRGTRYVPVPLSASGLQDVATASTSILSADTIFVKTVSGTEGAWFRLKKNDINDREMSVYIEGNKKTSFRFPFPGFGLSADDIDWTGPSINYNSQYFYLEDNFKRAIENEYWNFNTSLTSIDPLSLNNLNILSGGAFASDQYVLADKIKVWETPPAFSDGIYSGEIKEGWLYRVNRTDISVSPSGNSVIVWPYQKVDPEQEFPSYLPDNFTDVCAPYSLSGLQLPGSTCSDSITSADVLYKLANYKDTPETAIEGAWLSGTSFKYGKFEGVTQTGLNGVFVSGKVTKFVWEGQDNTEADVVFRTRSHQPNCSFVTTPSANYTTPGLCTCKQVLFTPFGHPGLTYTDNNRLGDFIAEDNFAPFDFDLNTWKDSFGTNFAQSSAFGWYKTNGSIGWGDGSWYTGVSAIQNKLFLRKGKTYVYYRANVQRQDVETNSLPPLIIRYPYNNINNSVWVKAIKNQDGTWASLSTVSDMVLYPGDILLYTKIDSTTINVTGEQISTAPITENRGSIWSLYDYISIGETETGLPQQVYVNYPDTTYTNITGLNATDPYKQYPSVSFFEILSVSRWTLTDPQGTKTLFDNTPSFTFSPVLTGTYNITVVAVTGSATGPKGNYQFTNIPPITAVSPITRTPSVTGFKLPVPGFIINTQLYGWNYNTGRADLNAVGIKPFWAKSFTDKNAETEYKGIDSWGQPFKIVDGYNIITQPEFSDIKLSVGNYFEYDRKYPSSFVWNQPLKLYSEVNEKIWSTITINPTATSNLSDIINNIKTDLVTVPTDTPSPIKLRNFVNNEPVEVYYNAITPFVWSVTATPTINELFYSSPSASLQFVARRPWNSLSNRYYPSIALLPTVEDLYTERDTGGYFTPNYLGASTYINQDYTATLSTSSENLTGLFSDYQKYIAGRGLTTTDQPTPYIDITDNNTWLKEPFITGSIAGNIKKSIAKKYQKFIPYQSAYESNTRIQQGLVHPTSRQSPWGGSQDATWTDTNNKPESFAGVVNVDVWAQSQVLKQTNKQLDKWTTDIFGNQYGLYKTIGTSSLYKRKEIYGEIWTRSNAQNVLPGSQSLSAVFDTYQNILQYSELTGTGVKHIDVFFDTLYIQTSGLLIFEKIIYDYETDKISSITDEARYISLAMPISASIERELLNIPLSGYTFAKAGETWFFPQEKEVIISVCELSGNYIAPSLYKLDLNNRFFSKIFPVKAEDIITINSLSSLNINQIQEPVISYDPLKKEFILAILAESDLNKNILIEIAIVNTFENSLKEINVYQPETALQALYPPVINQTLSATISANQSFVFQVSATNNPTNYIITQTPGWIAVNSTGLFFGTAPNETGIYYIPFVVSNNVGPTYYSLTLNVN